MVISRLVVDEHHGVCGVNQRREGEQRVVALHDHLAALVRPHAVAREEGRGVLVPERLGREGSDAGARAASHALEKKEAPDAIARLHLRLETSAHVRRGALSTEADYAGDIERTRRSGGHRGVRERQDRRDARGSAERSRASLRTTSAMSSANLGPSTPYPRAQLLPDPLCGREESVPQSHRQLSGHQQRLSWRLDSALTRLERERRRFAVFPEAAGAGRGAQCRVDDL